MITGSARYGLISSLSLLSKTCQSSSLLSSFCRRIFCPFFEMLIAETLLLSNFIKSRSRSSFCASRRALKGSAITVKIAGFFSSLAKYLGLPSACSSRLPMMRVWRRLFPCTVTRMRGVSSPSRTGSSASPSKKRPTLAVVRIFMVLSTSAGSALAITGASKLQSPLLRARRTLSELPSAELWERICSPSASTSKTGILKISRARRSFKSIIKPSIT